MQSLQARWRLTSHALYYKIPKSGRRLKSYVSTLIFTYPLTNLKYLDTLGILSLVFPCYDQFGFGGSNEPLYTSKDVGITLVDHSNFKNVILESDTAWMVEFYSSWCGHCIRFAPVFKELGTNVEGKFNVCLNWKFS